MHTPADVLSALHDAACNDHAAVALALLGTGAAAVDDQADYVDDRADASPPPVWPASFYGSADAALVLVQAEVDAEKAATATRDSGATPAEFTIIFQIRTLPLIPASWAG